MKKIYSIISILTGLLCAFYFLVQADLIELKMFIVDYKYNDTFYKVFDVYSNVLILLCGIIIIVSVIGIRNKWHNWPIVGLASAFLCIVSLFFMGGIPLIFVAFIVVGILGLRTKSQ